MEIEIQPNQIRLVVLAVVLILFITACSYGFLAGRSLARSELAVSQTQYIMRGLNYFFSDQDRYPGEAEFADPAVMRTYLSAVPVAQVFSKECPKPYTYETFDRKSFTFTFCVSRGFDVWIPGEHSTTEKDIATWLQ